jgi:hypothetical protein
MAKKKRGPGRPSTGRGAQVNVRCQPAFLKLVDKWRMAQPEKPSRPQAIVRLAAQSLKGMQP